MKIKRNLFITLVLVLFVGLNISIATAAEFKVSGERGNVTIGSEETIKNLYTAGNIISIDGEVQKDLYAAGNIVTVGGNVEDNVLAAGGTVIIKRAVGGNVHAAGGSVVIEGNIAEDLFIGGGNILISKSASIGGDLVVGGGTVDIQGPVTGKVLIGGGEVTLNSKISGLTNIKAEKITIGESAEIESNLKYTSPKEANIHDNAKIMGAVDFDQRAVKGKGAPSFKTVFGVLTGLFLLKTLIFILTGLVLIYFFRTLIKTVVRDGMSNTWSSLGVGFAVLFLTPIAGIILAITMVGLYLAGLLAVAYVLLLMLSSVIASITFGSWLIKTIKKRNTYSVRWQEVVVGVITLNIIAIIPIIGWLVGCAFMLISLGAMSRLIHRSIQKK